MATVMTPWGESLYDVTDPQLLAYYAGSEGYSVAEDAPVDMVVSADAPPPGVADPNPQTFHPSPGPAPDSGDGSGADF